ncbi:MAG: hypothetical protein NC039_06460 [Muribaculaceae bacterium]|nr:hypothetical protein [Muribaculaceae bacterium]
MPEFDDRIPEGLLEHVMFRMVKRLDRGSASVRFDREPHLGGAAGHVISAMSFSRNHDDIKSRIMRLVGNTIRIFTPWFKF